MPKGNVIAWKSRRCDRKLASTTSAELIALVESVKLAPRFIKLVENLWGKTPKVLFITDSQGVVGWLRKGRAEQDPGMQGYVDLARERLRDMHSDLLWIDTANQRADCHTKFKPVR